ncbi:MAG: stalk domain-containing protein [Bacillota bacterium]|nr:stalk domain-containing protein [Bacillota bacterium]
METIQSMKRSSMRGLALLLLVAMLITTWFAGSDASFAAPAPISVYLDGKKIEFDVQPTVIAGRTMVPVRMIFEALGAKIEFVSKTREIIARLAEREIKMQVNNDKMYVNGKMSTLDAAPVIINSRTLVPVRAISEALGVTVRWDGKSRMVLLGSHGYAESMIPTAKRMRSNVSDDNYFEFRIEGNQIHVEGKLAYDDYQEVWVNFYVPKDPNVLPGEKDWVRTETRLGEAKLGADRKFKMSGPIPDSRYVQVIGWGIRNEDRYPGDGESSRDWASLHEWQVTIEKKGNEYVFRPPHAYETNRAKMKQLKDPSQYLSLQHLSSVERERLTKIAAELSQGAKSDYEKLLRIHDWLTENFYYNREFHEKKTGQDYHMPIEVLDNQIARCYGYSIVFSDLARLMNIPCIKAIGYLNHDPLRPLFEKDPSTLHSWNVAYVDGRWIQIDVTYDNHHEFWEGKTTRMKPEHTYFDVELYFLSYDHVIDYFRESHIWN